MVFNRGPIVLADFKIIPIKAVRGKILLGVGWQRSPLLGEGIRDHLG
jgi:hypothetical protein